MDEDICEDIFGTFSTEKMNELQNYNKHPDYYHVTKIPKGATNIEIVQLGYPNDGNYIGKNGKISIIKENYLIFENYSIGRR